MLSGCSIFYDEKVQVDTEQMSQTQSNSNTSFSSKEDYSNSFMQIDRQIANSFNIDLNDYIKMENFYNINDSQNNKISLVHHYITKKYLEKEDTKPSVYLKKDNNLEGIILLKKANGIKKVFYTQLDKPITYDNPEIGITKAMEISK